MCRPATIQQAVQRAAPAITSTTKWLAVRITVTTMNAGITAPAHFSNACRAALTTANAINKFHPQCRLGMAAYWFVKSVGCNTR